MTPCKVPNYYCHLGQGEIVNWVRLALPENGTPSLVAINLVWAINMTPLHLLSMLLEYAT